MNPLKMIRSILFTHVGLLALFLLLSACESHTNIDDPIDTSSETNDSADTNNDTDSDTSTAGDSDTATDSDTVPLVGDWYVSPDGDDSAEGSKTNPWKTISRAVGAGSGVLPGQTILVLPGTYTEAVMVEISGTDGNPITLLAGGDVTVSDPDPTSDTGVADWEGVISIFLQSHWVINGFRIENSRFWGVGILGAEDVLVTNCHTVNTDSSGIYAGDHWDGAQSTNIRITHNIVEKTCQADTGGANDGTPDGRPGLQEALSLHNVDTFEVAYNQVFDGKREGIDVKAGSKTGTVHHNISHDHLRLGIYADGGTDVAFYSNTSYANEFGIIVAAERAGEISSAIDIFNNVLHDNRTWGLGVTDWGGGNLGTVADVSIVNNTLWRNGTIGIFTQGPTVDGVVIRNNISVASEWESNNLLNDGALNITAEANLITGDALFVDPTNRDFHLDAQSPAVDAGVATDAPELDADDEPRPAGTAIDQGAYEFRD